MSPSSNPVDLSQVVESFEALETVRSQLFVLPEGPALEMGQQMIEAQEAELRKSVAALPEGAIKELTAELDTRQELLDGYKQAQLSLEKIGAPVPEEITSAVARLDSEILEIYHSPEFGLFQFLRGAGSYAIQFTATGAETPDVKPVPTIPTETTPDSSTEVHEKIQKPAVDVTLEINEEGFSFLVLRGAGGRKKEIRLSQYHSSSVKTDYSAHRAAALKVILEHPDEELGVATLWNDMQQYISDPAEPTPEYDRETMTAVRSFITDLRYGRQPIIEHNGKRGPSSAYGINPNLRVQPVVDIMPEELQRLATIISARQAVAQSDPKPEEAPAPAEEHEAHTNQEDRVLIEDLVAFLQFVDLHEIVADSYAELMAQDGSEAVAKFLQSRHDWLSLLAELQNTATADSVGSTVKLSDQEIIDRRIKTLNSLFVYIDDSELLQERLDKLEKETDDQAGFSENLMLVLSDITEHLKTFSSEERALLKQFVQIKAIQKIEELTGTFSRGSIVASVGTIYEIGDHQFQLDEAGKLVPIPGPEYVRGGVMFDEEDFEVVPDPVGPLGAVTREVIKNVLDVEPPAEEVVEVAPEEEAVQPAKKLRRRRSSKLSQDEMHGFLQEWGDMVDDIVQEALDGGLVNGATPGQFYAVFNMEPRNIRNAAENGHIDRNSRDKHLSLRDVVEMVFRQRHSATPYITHPRLVKATRNLITKQANAAIKAIEDEQQQRS